MTTRGIADAYIAGEASPFFDSHFSRLEDWEWMRRVARPLAPDFLEILEAQNSRYERSPKRDANLRALGTGAITIVTGHQTGLFLGPLYAIYKTATTIRLAQWLTEKWSTPVVPVFWLQTEDHDAAEISVCHIARGIGEPLTLKLEVSDDAISVAQRVLPESVGDALQTLGDTLSRLPHADEHLELLARHYKPGAGWGQAFAGALATLFAQEGLVLVDPRDPVLAPFAAPVHRRALTDAREISRALGRRVRALESAGVRASVHIRENAPLFFFHPDGPEGPRCRLGAADGGLVEVGGKRTHTEAELLQVLESSPGSFSTSALLRPILQDTWFPTAAYVGGKGEIAYFAQMAPLYAAFDVAMPIVVPRLQLRLIDDLTRRTLTLRGLTTADASLTFGEAMAVARAGAADAPGGDRLTQRLVAGIDRALADIAPLVRAAGEKAEQSLEKTRGSMARSAEKLGRNYDKALLLQNGEVVNDIRRIQAWLQPRGIPQEGYFALASFAARYGQRAVVERVLALATPLRVGIEDLDL